jgi:trimeric autotransporter adhesin
MKKIMTAAGLLAMTLHLEAQNIGIGTTNPLAKFSVGPSSQFQVDTVGNIKRINNIPYSFPTIQGATGQVLGNNGTGQLEWVNQLGGWSLNGNSGNPAGYFLGTTDTMPLYFRVNNIRAGAIDQVRANVFLGSNSGGTATTGDGNAAIGFNSLNSLTTGTSNSALGINSLRSNTTGSSNVGIGANALFANTTGSSITAVGSSVLYSNTTGSSNTGVGNNALLSNTQGSSNSALGNNALYNNTMGGSNTAIGTSSMYTNTIGALNTAIGNGTLYFNQSGSTNTAIGNNSLYNSTGNANTGVGHNSLNANTSGSNNTAIGTGALITLATQSYNTALGAGADVSSDSVSNSTAVGANAISNASNQVTLGDVNITNVRSAGTYGTLSDGRFKENVRENVAGLAFIMQLRPVTYTLNTEKLHNHITSGKKTNQIPAGAFAASSAVVHTGFIAQEVEAAALRASYNFDGVYRPAGNNDNYSLSYAQFVVPLVKAVQELNRKVEDQEALIQSLTKRLEALEAK